MQAVLAAGEHGLEVRGCHRCNWSGIVRRRPDGSDRGGLWVFIILGAVGKRLEFLRPYKGMHRAPVHRGVRLPGRPRRPPNQPDTLGDVKGCLALGSVEGCVPEYIPFR